MLVFIGLEAAEQPALHPSALERNLYTSYQVLPTGPSSADMKHGLSDAGIVSAGCKKT